MPRESDFASRPVNREILRHLNNRPHSLCFRGVAEFGGDLRRQLDTTKCSRLGTLGIDSTDCFRLRRYLHWIGTDGFRWHARASGESRRSIIDLGNNRDFMPSTLGTLSTKWMPPVQTNDQFHASREAALKQIDADYNDRLNAIKEKKNPNALSRLQKLFETSPEAAKAEAEKLMAAWETEGDEELALKAELVNRDVEIRERFNREHLDAQIAQVQRARVVTRFSPAAIVQYTLESMAGTGFNRHLQYLEHVHQYTKQFRQFIVETDRADTQSRHLIGIPEGMSQKPFSSEAIPKFKDKIAFSDTFNTATLDLLLLILLLGVFFSGAFLIFIRSEV